MKVLIYTSLILICSCLPVTKGPLQYRLKGLTGNALTQVDLVKLDATYTNVRKHIFKDKCLRCHGEERTKLGVDLTEYDKVFGFSDFFQPIVVKNDPDSSGVYTEVARGAMPPKNPLSDEEVEFIKRWIEEGAKE